MMEEAVRTKLTEIYDSIDTDGGGTISQKEFQNMTNLPDVLDVLSNIGVQTDHLIALSDTLFQMDEDEIEKALEESVKSGKKCSVAQMDTSRELNFEQFLEL